MASNIYLCIINHQHRYQSLATGNQCLTFKEQVKLLQDFYNDIYEEERHFGNEGSPPHFDDNDEEPCNEEGVDDNVSDDKKED